MCNGVSVDRPTPIPYFAVRMCRQDRLYRYIVWLLPFYAYIVLLLSDLQCKNKICKGMAKKKKNRKWIKKRLWNFMLRAYWSIFIKKVFNTYSKLLFQGNDILGAILEGYPKTKKQLYVSVRDVMGRSVVWPVYR